MRGESLPDPFSPRDPFSPAKGVPAFLTLRVALVLLLLLLLGVRGGVGGRVGVGFTLAPVFSVV